MAASSSRPLDLTVRIEGANGTLRAFRDLPKEASDALRDKAQELSKLMARWVSDAGQSEGAQAALLAGTVVAKRDRLPYIAVGGTKRIGHAWPGAGKAPAWRLLFGSEFGHSGAGGRGKGSGDFAPHGFKPHRGREGYWIFPTVERHEADISKAWQEAADEVIERFTRAADGPAQEVT